MSPALAGLRVAIAAALFAAAIDQTTKWLIAEVVMQPPRLIALAPFLNLTLGFNPGISFGLFKDVFDSAPLLLAAGQSLIVVALLTGAAFARNRMEAIGLGLVAGGAAGNIVDRVRIGAVTDFIDFHVGGWHWPAFNAGDTAIVFGAALIVGAALVPKRPGNRFDADSEFANPVRLRSHNERRGRSGERS